MPAVEGNDVIGNGVREFGGAGSGAALAETIPVIVHHHTGLAGVHNRGRPAVAVLDVHISPLGEDRARRVVLASVHHAASVAVCDRGLRIAHGRRTDLRPCVPGDLAGDEPGEPPRLVIPAAVPEHDVLDQHEVTAQRLRQIGVSRSEIDPQGRDLGPVQPHPPNSTGTRKVPKPASLSRDTASNGSAPDSSRSRVPAAISANTSTKWARACASLVRVAISVTTEQSNTSAPTRTDFTLPEQKSFQSQRGSVQ